MTYTAQTWSDNNPVYPLTAARMSYIEAGIAAIANLGSVPVNVKDAGYGAKGDAKTVTDGAITSGQTAFTSLTAAFTNGDVGKKLVVNGAGSAGAALITTISAYVSATQVTLSLAASTTVTGATVIFGSDDTAAFQAAANDIHTAGGGTLLIPSVSTYLLTASVRCYSNTLVVIQPGATVDMSAAAAVAAFTGYGVLSDGTTLATAANLGPGKVGAVSLTADTTVHGSSLTVASGAEAGFAKNTWALVGSGKVYEIQTGIYGQTTVSGNQTVIAGANLAVASTSGFAASGMFYSGGQQYVYTAVADGTHLTLRDGGTFTDTYLVGTGARIGELVKVSSNSVPGTISLYSALESGYVDNGGSPQLIYQTTDLPAAFAQPITPVSNLIVTGGGMISGSPTTSGQQGVRIEFGIDCHVANVNMQHLTSSAILLSCIDSTLDQVDGTDFWNPGSGYCAEIGDASQNCVASRVSSDRQRHVATLGTASTTGYGQTRHCTVRDSSADDTVNSGAAFDTHGNAEDAIFDNVHVSGSSEEAIRIRCGWATVRNSSAQGTRNDGILAVNYTLAPTRFYLGEGSQFQDCGTAGFPGIHVQWTGLVGHFPPVWAVKVRGQIFTPGNVGANISGNSSAQMPAVDVDVEVVTPGSANGAMFLTFLDQPTVGGNLRELTSSTDGVRLDHCNKPSLEKLVAHYQAAGSGAAVRATSVTGGTINGVVCPNGGKGLVFDNASTGIIVGAANDFTGCTTPYSLGTSTHLIAQPMKVVSVTGAYSVTQYDTIVLADATSASLTVTLPTAVGIKGFVFTTKQISSGANTVTLATTTAQTILDPSGTATTKVLAGLGASLTVVSDGSNWQVI